MRKAYAAVGAASLRTAVSQLRSSGGGCNNHKQNKEATPVKSKPSNAKHSPKSPQPPPDPPCTPSPGTNQQNREEGGSGGSDDEEYMNTNTSGQQQQQHHHHHHSRHHHHPHNLHQQQHPLLPPLPLDVASLTAKNYRLAKELSELRVRHREEHQKLTRVSVENMTLSGKYRDALNQLTMMRKEVAFYRNQSEILLAKNNHKSNDTNTTYSNTTTTTHHTREGEIGDAGLTSLSSPNTGDSTTQQPSESSSARRSSSSSNSSSNSSLPIIDVVACLDDEEEGDFEKISSPDLSTLEMATAIATNMTRCTSPNTPNSVPITDDLYAAFAEKEDDDEQEESTVVSPNQTAIFATSEDSLKSQHRPTTPTPVSPSSSSSSASLSSSSSCSSSSSPVSSLVIPQENNIDDNENENVQEGDDDDLLLLSPSPGDVVDESSHNDDDDDDDDDEEQHLSLLAKELMNVDHRCGSHNDILRFSKDGSSSSFPPSTSARSGSKPLSLSSHMIKFRVNEEYPSDITRELIRAKSRDQSSLSSQLHPQQQHRRAHVIIERVDEFKDDEDDADAEANTPAEGPSSLLVVQQKPPSIVRASSIEAFEASFHTHFPEHFASPNKQNRAYSETLNKRSMSDLPDLDRKGEEFYNPFVHSPSSATFDNWSATNQYYHNTTTPLQHMSKRFGSPGDPPGRDRTSSSSSAQQRKSKNKYPPVRKSLTVTFDNAFNNHHHQHDTRNDFTVITQAHQEEEEEEDLILRTPLISCSGERGGGGGGAETTKTPRTFDDVTRQKNNRLSRRSSARTTQSPPRRNHNHKDLLSTRASVSVSSLRLLNEKAAALELLQQPAEISPPLPRYYTEITPDTTRSSGSFSLETVVSDEDTDLTTTGII